MASATMSATVNCWHRNGVAAAAPSPARSPASPNVACVARPFPPARCGAVAAASWLPSQQHRGTSSRGQQQGRSALHRSHPSHHERDGRPVRLGVRRSNLRCKAGQEGDSQQPKKMEVSYDPRGTMDMYAQENDPDRSIRGPSSLSLFSPSKVNVFLRITRKRPDGYHELASLFHTINLGDVLKFSISPSQRKDSLTTNAFGVPLDDSNLIIKAFNLFRKKTGINTYFWVHLDKRVPTGAGLGGGSGNAATALWAANEMTGGTVSEAQLQEWSGEIGSDIPFFFSNGAAYCTGRGEIVEDLSAELHLSDPLVLMKPKEACGTADVYRKFRLDRASEADPVELLRRVQTDGISQDVCVNDLEAPAFEVLPSLKAFKTRVSKSGRGRYSAVFMSGSGSTIVGVGDFEPPPFLYEEDAYADVFVSEAAFIKRQPGQWYQPALTNSAVPGSASEGAVGSREEAMAAMSEVAVGKMASGVAPLDKLPLPFSFEA